ncbi:hypothetical protein MBLNU459_g6372t3 [Dothideomycetes sp. NU459]
MTAICGDTIHRDNPFTLSPDDGLTSVLDRTPDLSSCASLPKSTPEDACPEPSSSSATNSRIEKRKANTAAARRYRQRRLDRVSELEEALKAIQQERDELKVQVAKLQGENQVLKGIVHRPRDR